jgi:hypothetical protein
LYIAFNKTFVKDLAFASYYIINSKDDSDTNDTKNNVDISTSEMFRRYFVMVVMVMGLFVCMFLFLHYWDTEQSIFYMYVFIFFALIASTILAQRGDGWFLIFYLILALATGVKFYIYKK